MSLPTFKFTNFGAPTNNESANSGLSTNSKMEKSGIFSTIKEKAQDTFKDVSMPEISLGTTSGDSDDESGGFFSFSFWTLIKIILVAAIVWFMWGSLSNNGEFHLGMGELGDKLKSFFTSMEDKGRELIARITNQPIPQAGSKHRESENDSENESDSDSDSESESDSDHERESDNQRQPSSRGKRRAPIPASAHQPPVPPGMTNSSDKKPGFINDDTKYTFLDKADRSYTGSAPRADDSTSVTQKHQAGKSGYCYIGEDRGFRSCVKVEAADKCMSGQVFSRQDICVDPTLRE